MRQLLRLTLDTEPVKYFFSFSSKENSSISEAGWRPVHGHLRLYNKHIMNETLMSSHEKVTHRDTKMVKDSPVEAATSHVKPLGVHVPLAGVWRPLVVDVVLTFKTLTGSEAETETGASANE